MRARMLTERLRESLFFVPMAYLLLGAVLGLVALAVDREVVDTNAGLPFGLTSTVESARAVLGTVASATITVAGIAFSISLLVIQLASSQYSPRVVHGLLRDPFSKRIMGLVVGTFTYCLVVLRSVRDAVDDGGDAVIPNVSVAIAVVLGVLSILGIIAFIDHSAHSMDVSRILSRATSDAVRNVHRLWHDDVPDGAPRSAKAPAPDDHLVIPHGRDGWIQNIDLDALVRAVGAGGTVRLDTEVGRYAVRGTPLCTVWPVPEDPDLACERARSAVVTGASRTAEQDIAYGVRQLADVALRALSASVNDPTTAQDALFHMGTVLRETLSRYPPPAAAPMADDRVLLRPARVGPVELIGVGFDEVRLAAAGMPSVCLYLLELLHLLDGSADGDDAVRAELRQQAALIRSSADHADLGPHDADRIRAGHDRRFGPDAS